MLLHRSLELGSFGAQALNATAGVIAARALGPSSRGDLVIVATWGQLAGWFWGLSLDKALITAKPTDRHRAWRTVLELSIGLGAAGAISIYLAAYWRTSSHLASAAAASVAFGTVAFELASGLLVGNRSDRRFAVNRYMQAGIYAGTTVGVALAWPHNRSDAAVIAVGVGLSLSLLLPALLTISQSWRQFPPESGSDQGHTRRILVRSALSLHGGATAQALNGRLDLLLLPLVLSPSEVGQYAVGLSLGRTSAYFSNAAYMRALRSPRAPVDPTTVLTVGLASVIVAFSAPAAIPFVFGHGYHASVAIAQLFAVASSFDLLLAVATARLVGLGCPLLATSAQSLGALAFASGLLLTRSSHGAAMSSLTSYGVGWLFAQSALVLRRSTIRARPRNDLVTHTA